VYAAKKINNGISATATVNCIAPDWPVSHFCLFAREKSAPDCDAASRQNSTQFFDHLLSLGDRGSFRFLTRDANASRALSGVHSAPMLSL